MGHQLLAECGPWLGCWRPCFVFDRKLSTWAAAVTVASCQKECCSRGPWEYSRSADAGVTCVVSSCCRAAHNHGCWRPDAAEEYRASDRGEQPCYPIAREQRGEATARRQGSAQEQVDPDAAEAADPAAAAATLWPTGTNAAEAAGPLQPGAGGTVSVPPAAEGDTVRQPDVSAAAAAGEWAANAHTQQLYSQLNKVPSTPAFDA